MPQTQQTTMIGELEVTSVQLAPVHAYLLLAKVGKVLVPALAAARGVSGSSDLNALAPALSQLFDTLSPALAQSLLLEGLASTSVVAPDASGKLLKIDLTSEAMINRAFAGNVKGMLLALKFALEVNYGSFFVGLGAAASETPTPSP